jgi:methylmalonyl-CoA mutase, C-terminal domain
VPIMLGGLIHEDDEPALLDMGVRGIFGPGSTTGQIIDFMRHVTGKSVGGVEAGTCVRPF